MVGDTMPETFDPHLDPPSKKAHDESRTDRPAVSAAPVTIEQTPFVFPRAPRRGLWRRIAIFLAMAVTACGIFVFAMYPREMPAKRNVVADTASEFAQPPTASDSPNPALAQPLIPPKTPSETSASKSSTLPVSPAPQTKITYIEHTKPAIDPLRTAVFRRAVTDVKTALADRDLAAASDHVKVASANAQTTEQRNEVDRIETMLEHLIQFWSSVRKAMGKLQPTEEIILGENRMVVVENNRTVLTVKAEGRIQQFRLETLPTPLVMFLVDRYLGKDPGSLAIIGTFLAVDPHGDRALAKQYWQEAARANIDTEKLLRDLDAMPQPAGRQGHPMPTKDSGNK